MMSREQDAPLRRSIRTASMGSNCACGIRVPPYSSHECGPASAFGPQVERILLRAQEDVDALTFDLEEARRELERVMNERDLAVLTLAAFTPADQPLPTMHAYDDDTVDPRPTTEGND